MMYCTNAFFSSLKFFTNAWSSWRIFSVLAGIISKLSLNTLCIFLEREVLRKWMVSRHTIFKHLIFISFFVQDMFQVLLQKLLKRNIRHSLPSDINGISWKTANSSSSLVKDVNACTKPNLFKFSRIAAARPAVALQGGGCRRARRHIFNNTRDF